MQTWRSNRDDEVPTLGVLRRGHSWLWICCEGKDCARSAAVALAPFIIRWGAEASSNLLRRNARCQKCGTKGVTIQLPGWFGPNNTEAPFPVDRMSPWPKLIRAASPTDPGSAPSSPAL